MCLDKCHGCINIMNYFSPQIYKDPIMKQIIQIFIFLLLGGQIIAQYQFTHTHDLECTPVKNQANTGTCWSFATASFIESELMRQGFKDLNLSEMYVVRNIYRDKAFNYLMRQGKANFSQGSLSHDLIRAIAKHGITTEEAYSGLINGEKAHNHGEMEAGLKGFLDGILSARSLSDKWDEAFEAILDAYMGEVPKKFEYNGKSYTAESFAEYLGINSDDFVNLSSFTHHDFYTDFILEIPDNYSNGSYYNIPIDELIEAIDRAVENGYSVAWDGDVGEKSFSASEGIAVMPVDIKREDLFKQPEDEMAYSQELRQEMFESFKTTDDHLMHIVGKARDQNGTEYYIIKNSWGEISQYKGYLYMSKNYVALKTISIMLHRDALNAELKARVSSE